MGTVIEDIRARVQRLARETTGLPNSVADQRVEEAVRDIMERITRPDPPADKKKK